MNNNFLPGRSSLGGLVKHNPNFGWGDFARLIIDQVVGASPSALNGPVAKSAPNPHCLNKPVPPRAGDAANPGGSFFNFDPPTSIVQTRIDNAILPQWINPSSGVLEGVSPINASIEASFPDGTKFYYGPVSSQGGVYVGGQDKIQVYVPDARSIGTFTPKGPIK